MCSHTHMFSLKTLAENKRKERDMFRCEMITSRSDVMDLHKHFLYVGSKREKVEVEVCACLRRVCSYIYIIANVCVCCVCCVIKTLQYSQLRTSSEYQWNFNSRIFHLYVYVNFYRRHSSVVHFLLSLLFQD